MSRVPCKPWWLKTMEVALPIGRTHTAFGLRVLAEVGPAHLSEGLRPLLPS